MYVEVLLLTLMAGPRFINNTFVPWNSTGEYAENTVPPLGPKFSANVLRGQYWLFKFNIFKMYVVHVYLVPQDFASLPGDDILNVHLCMTNVAFQ